jgi:hypothetical protein
MLWAEEGCMNAVLEEVSRMVVEDRIARIESDVAEVKGDLKTLSTEFRDFKTEVAKEFGSVRVELQSLRTSIERTKIWMLGTGISTVLGVAALVLKLH